MIARLHLAFVVSVAWIGTAAAQQACGPMSIPEMRRGTPNAPTVQIYGTVKSVAGATFVLSTRDGATIGVDAAAAINDERAVDLSQGMPVVVIATRGQHGELVAQAVARAKPMPIAWGNDCLEPGAK